VLRVLVPGAAGLPLLAQFGEEPHSVLQPAVTGRQVRAPAPQGLRPVAIPWCVDALARCAVPHRLDERRIHGQVSVTMIEGTSGC
jgi:hypothetical protein